MRGSWFVAFGISLGVACQTSSRSEDEKQRELDAARNRAAHRLDASAREVGDPGRAAARAQAEAAAPAAAPATGARTESGAGDAAAKAGPQEGAPKTTSSVQQEIEEEMEKARQRLGSEAENRQLGVDDFTEDQERIVGEATARSILSRFKKLSPDSAVSIYVRKVGAVLVESSSRPGIPYRFVVLETDEVNAFAAPYGFVFITTGALRFLKNEAELALILAHEVAHVELKHGLEAILRAQLDIQKRAARDRLDKLAKPLPEEQKKAQDELQSEMDRLSDIVLKAQGLPQEKEADRTGLLLVSRAGYDPAAAMAFFARCPQATSQVDDKPPILRSHPMVSERIEAANAIVARLPRGGAVLAERFLQSTRPIR
jgi:predicted Zn-dependent protease